MAICILSYLPKNTVIQLGNPKDKDYHVYQYKSENFQFNNFSKSTLYPIDGLEYYGNRKKL